MHHSQYLWRETKIIERAKALKVNAGTEPDTDLGPVISKQVCSWFYFSSYCNTVFQLKISVANLQCAFKNYCHGYSMHVIFTPIFVYILAIYVSQTLSLAAQAKERVHRLVQSGVESGAKLLLDGRNIVVAFIPSTTFINFLIEFFLNRTNKWKHNFELLIFVACLFMLLVSHSLDYMPIRLKYNKWSTPKRKIK